ncbi:MAG: DUF305 domain-containing protein [bacterium]
MNTQSWRRNAAALALALALPVAQAATAQQTVAKASSSGGHVRSEPDVNFMSGMIAHHAQAVIMAGWAESHGARLDVRTLCERIVVGQRDEIGLMQYWLREHGEPVPDATSTKMKMKMDGMVHEMLMPGMMSDEEMAALDKARGPDFDRLFLEGMIRHHGGALTMVNELLAANNAAQDDVVYRMSSDVWADQTTEIERMTKMLATVPGAKSAP